MSHEIPSDGLAPTPTEEARRKGRKKLKLVITRRPSIVATLAMVITNGAIELGKAIKPKNKHPKQN